MILKYVAEITGHEPPYKWKVTNPATRPVAGYTPPNGQVSSMTGEADSYEDALFEASQAAHKMEGWRRHRHTVRREELFEIDTDEETDDLPDWAQEGAGN